MNTKLAPNQYRIPLVVSNPNLSLTEILADIAELRAKGDSITVHDFQVLKKLEGCAVYMEWKITNAKVESDKAFWDFFSRVPLWVLLFVSGLLVGYLLFHQ